MENSMKSVLITGAYGGMGHAATELLAKQGFRVFAMDLHVGAPAENVIPIQADITQEESLRKAFSQVKQSTQQLYAIVHFAGIYMLDSLVEMENDQFRRIMDVNLRGAYLVNKLFLPLLQPGSRIVMTTSELAPLDPLPFTGIYAVSKAALDKYAYSLAMELQLLNIRVSVLRAGAVQTNMLGVSTTALDRFCEKTKLYSCNATRFRKIVQRVEARCIPTEKLAQKVLAILCKRKPGFAYTINRNPLLLLLHLLPKRLQLSIIKKILQK